MTLSLPCVRATTTRRASTVESGLTTKTNAPCWPVCSAWAGTTMASGSTASVRATFTNWPGHSRRSAFANVAFRRMVPVFWSTALSMNVTVPRSDRDSPEATASTARVPPAM